VLVSSRSQVIDLDGLTPASKEALASLLRKFDPNQPRVPAGSSDGGQWTDGGGGGGSGSVGDQIVRIASAGIATLVAELPYTGGGRYCVYDIGGRHVIIPGPNYAACMPWTTYAGTWHGTLLNDSRR